MLYKVQIELKVASMYVLFIDDSGQKGTRSGMGHLISVGGIVLNEDQLRPLQDNLSVITAKYGIPEDCELKWSPPRSNWIHNNLAFPKRQDCYREVLEATKACGASVIVVVFDTGRTSLQKEKATLKALEFFIDRARMYLEDKQALGIIVADQVAGGKKQEMRFLTDTLSTIQHGSAFVPPKQISLNILTTPSRLVRQLQVADLVVGITTARVAGHRKYAAPLFPIIKDMMIKNALGKIGGTGLKIFPVSLTNLYYWVLDEDCYAKVSMMAGISLPDTRFPYTENEYK